MLTLYRLCLLVFTCQCLQVNCGFFGFWVWFFFSVFCPEFIVIICRNFNLVGSYYANPKWNLYPTGFRKLVCRVVPESIGINVLYHSKGLPFEFLFCFVLFNKVAPVSLFNWNLSQPSCNPLSSSHSGFCFNCSSGVLGSFSVASG